MLTARSRPASPINGKTWGRPDDTIGVAGIINGLAPNHQAYFAAGGFGILVGDGALPNYGLEQIVEAYYSYAITDSTESHVRLSVHRQSRLQRRPRPGKCFCRPVPYPVLGQ